MSYCILGINRKFGHRRRWVPLLVRAVVSGLRYPSFQNLVVLYGVAAFWHTKVYNVTPVDRNITR
jgi:hypothetical protein